MPERGRLAVTAAVAVVSLLALVALASRSGAIVGGDGSTMREPSDGVVDYVFTLGLALLVVLMAATAWAMRLSARFTQDRSFGLGPSLLAVALVFGIVLLALTRLDVADLGRDGAGQGGQSGTPPRVEPAQPRPAMDEPSEPSVRWGALAVVAALGGAAVAGLLARRSLRRRAATRPPNESALVDELTAAVDVALADLDSEPDARRAVIAAYARMERALASHGLDRHVSEAPLEYLARISPSLSSSRRLVFELTHLYERARFSAHAVDREMKADAIATLAALRDELEAAAA